MSLWLGQLLAGGGAAAVAAAMARLEERRRRAQAVGALARACHEIRGPLAAIGLIAQLGARTGSLDGARLYALQGELARAATALEDLEAQRGDPLEPALRLERLTVAEVMSELTQAARARLAAEGRELSCRAESGASGGASGGAAVLVDSARLAQALVNLTANAAEHGAGTIELGWGVERGRLRIEVRDEGPGLAEAVPVLVHRGRRTHGRRGHGLAIAAGILRAHGGRLVSAPAERGARMVLELPVRNAAWRRMPERRTA